LNTTAVNGAPNSTENLRSNIGVWICISSDYSALKGTRWIYYS
jgi:hypothetical protein